jgi:hypothetical protein
MLALRLDGHEQPFQTAHGFTKKETQSKNLQAQAPQAHEGESPQEASALQVVE